MLDFYIPNSNRELLSVLKKFYPTSRFSGMKRKQLLAVYIKTRKLGMVIR